MIIIPKIFPLVFTLFILLINSELSYGQLIINEASASNKNIVVFDGGEYYDWIEILNTGTEATDLSDYSLSDDSSNLSKWTFPEYLLNPDEYFLLFASGNDIVTPQSCWQTVVNHGDNWRYILPSSNIDSWNTVSFNDDSWEKGPSGIGYGDGDDATTISSTISLYMRINFNIADVSQIEEAALQIDFDDGFVAYINGSEIARTGVSGTPPGFNTAASPGREAKMYNGGNPLEFSISNPSAIFQDGDNVLAIEIHNGSESSSDLSSIPFLSILTPANSGNPPPEILGLPNHLLHTNFKLDADGDSLYLSNSSGKIIDSLFIITQYPNHAYGRIPGEYSDWHLFDKPTPGVENSTDSYIDYMARKPVFSTNGGKFTAPFQLTLTSTEPNDTIYYTTDGTEPEITSSVYTELLDVSDNIVVRARIIKHDYITGPAVTNTYFQQSSNGLPVITITTDPDNMFDFFTGIYELGPNAQDNFPYFESNFWNDWERPVNVTMYDGDSMAFTIDAGIKIFGGWSRGYPQKSFSIFARSKYGEGKIKYQLFKDRPIYEFESFILRNSGNDWFGQESQAGSMMRDVLMTKLTKNLNIESQGSRQAVVYINEEYWGIYNIRDKINEHFLASNSGAKPDNIDLLETNYNVIIGSNHHYVNLIDFVTFNSMADKSNYNYVTTQMDIQDFINYELSQIYFDNRDWPGNNIKYWRETGPSSRWRWIIFDTDFGFGLWDLNKAYYNTIEFATDPDQTNWPNPTWSTLLLRKLLINQKFKEQFINSFADQINTSFKNSAVTDLIDELKMNIYHEMTNHIDVWGGSFSNWNSNIGNMKSFANIRPAAMQNFIRSSFSTGSKHELTLNLSDKNNGAIKLNTIMVRESPWEGTYFEDIPIKLTAIPSPGYVFTGWSEGINSKLASIYVDLSAATTITANFEPDSNPGNRVIINEICYNSDPVNNTEDWVELFNTSDQYVDLSNWILKDGGFNNGFVIQEGTILEPNRYYVICRDKYALSAIHTDIYNYQGNFDFGLSSVGDVVWLQNSNGDSENYLTYGITNPWPIIPAGSGYTLSLLSPELDNFSAESWAISEEQYGTPGRCNYCPVGVEEKLLPEQEDIMFQNFPNPFSNSTRIVFQLAKFQPVRLSVYDLNGRLVNVLLNQNLEEGYHEIVWEPQDLHNGIYILRMETVSAVSTKQMILVR